MNLSPTSSKVLALACAASADFGINYADSGGQGRALHSLVTKGLLRKEWKYGEWRWFPSDYSRSVLSEAEGKP